MSKIDVESIPLGISAIGAVITGAFQQFDMAILFCCLMIFFYFVVLNDHRRKEIMDLQLQIEELQERLDDVDAIVNHIPLPVNSRYIGQDTSRPSAPEAQDDGRDAEDHAA